MSLIIDRFFRYIAAVLLLGAVALTPVAAGGSREAEQSTPPETAPPETAAPEATEDAPAQADEESDDVVPMDERTANTLVALGMMPFDEKIPSEDFRLGLLEGGETSLTDHLGSVVFLNFWATWCPPCREEMPSMQALYDELGDEGLEILAVNVLEDAETARGFIDEYGFTYPVLLDTDGRVMMRYGVRAYPTTYIVDRDGYVIGVRPGFHDWAGEEVVAGMRALLETE